MLGNLVGGLAFTGLTLYATHVRTAPKREAGDPDARRAGLNLTSTRGASAWQGEAPFCFGAACPRELQISIGQHSDKGRKETNQDFHGALIPAEPLLSLKGIAVVLADGISSSNVSQIASESAVKSFLTDYYCTSESWSVKTSAQRVMAATNSWLHAQTRRSQYPYDKDRGYVCTLSAMVIKSTTAHIFHVGDCRIYRVAGHALEQLTEDHRVVVSSEQSYLGRALGINPQIEIDYQALQRRERRRLRAGDRRRLRTCRRALRRRGDQRATPAIWTARRS